jgi:hypothetical protein
MDTRVERVRKMRAFGNLAIPTGPMVLRPTLADGLPLSRLEVCFFAGAQEQPSVSLGQAPQGGQEEMKLSLVLIFGSAQM